MIASYLSWTHLPGDIDRHLGSLGALSARLPAIWRSEDVALAQLKPASGTGGRAGPQNRNWHPAKSPSGQHVLFTGWLDNAAALQRELGTASADPALVYGAALDRWGDQADLHAIGEYATIVHNPANRELRLARSPWTAPPLHYFHTAQGAAAASVLRVLHACGLPRVLDKRKVGDNLFFNLTADEGWFEGGFEVKPGTIVRLSPGGVRKLVYYDHLAQREPLRLARAEDYVEAVDALLDEVIRSTLRESRRPAVQLSGGLDSSNVTARVLRALPADQRLDSYTFLPHPEWHGTVPKRFYASERPKVEEFARMHPRLNPHFSANEDADFDAAFSQMFLAMGFAPTSLPNVAPLHPLYRMAARDGCDLMIGAGHGNLNFSSSGEWGFTEYLLTGRWGQLYKALANGRGRQCSIPRALFSWSIKPLLPMPLQRAIARIRGTAEPHACKTITPIRSEFAAEHQLEQRAREARLMEDDLFRRSRRVALADMFARGDMNGGDINLANEQIHGIRTRDVTAYRPLMEFCHAAPTDVFLRNGEERWLARQLGKGLLPEGIRTERRYGQPIGDWHFRLARRLPELRAEIEAAENDPILAEIIDFPEMRRRLDDFPDEASFEYETMLKYALGLPRAVMAARFARHVSGRNDG